ncbi:MAG TPA: elongation factor Ts [Methylococcaceae bacterium]|jgi:elongation factor Ts|nr:elongation factor Ts [Methylococcaceae bacterium]HIA45617.1 elongation factor Ts [Methylococcaceae bacterium]HIN68679.1 elongation factor Ts [Methylococcales bacterium]HIO44429.1 elongation factor Ts [Methylococcales bacterium]
MKISAAMVKELRERTGSGMMECKRALTATEGDLELAVDQMRKAGLAKADKKSGRIAAEGTIGVKVSDDGKTVAMVDVNCETDFVSKGDEFKGFAAAVAEAVLLANDETIEDINVLGLANGQTVDGVRREMIAKLGENITVRRYKKFASQGGMASYLHGSRIGVIVELQKADAALGKDIAMHVAATKPFCVGEENVPAEMIAKEKDIFSAQAAESGKPAAIIEKMVTGRIKKYLAEVTLLGQAFIKDDKQTVAKIVADQGNAVIRFERFEVGEGIEKKEENFADEVMAQVRGG